MKIRTLVLTLSLFFSMTVLSSCQEQEEVKPSVNREVPTEKYKEDESNPPVNTPD